MMHARGFVGGREKQELQDRVKLPHLHNYPAPPGLSGDVSDEKKMEALTLFSVRDERESLRFS